MKLLKFRTIFFVLTTCLFVSLANDFSGQGSNVETDSAYKNLINEIYREYNLTCGLKMQTFHSMDNSLYELLDGMTIEMIEGYWRQNGDSDFVQKLFKIHNSIFRRKQNNFISNINGDYNVTRKNWEQLCFICHLSPMCYKFQTELLSFFYNYVYKATTLEYRQKIELLSILLDGIKIYDSNDILSEIMCDGGKKLILNEATIKLFCATKLFKTIFLCDGNSETWRTEIMKLSEFGVAIQSIDIDTHVSVNSLVKVTFLFPRGTFVSKDCNFVFLLE